MWIYKELEKRLCRCLYIFRPSSVNRHSICPPAIGGVYTDYQRLIFANFTFCIGKFQSANKFVTVIGKHFAASIRSLNLCLHIGHKGTLFPRHFGVIVFHTHIIIYLIFPIIAQRIDSLTSSLQSWTKERSEAFKGLCAKHVAEEHRSAALMLL